MLNILYGLAGHSVHKNFRQTCQTGRLMNENSAQEQSSSENRKHTHTYILSLSIIWVLDLGQTIVCLSKPQNNERRQGIRLKPLN